MLVPEIKKIEDLDSKNYNEVDIDETTCNGSLYNYDIFCDDKKKVKFCKDIERIIRSSYEYRNYIGILKTELDYTKCTFLPNIDITNVKIPIEFHHYPFTLYDLVSIEVDYEIDRGCPDICDFDIADRIIKYHYQNLVGLVPLSETIHELVHDGQKFINIKYVKGDYESYMKKFSHKIPEEFYNKVNNIKDLSDKEDRGVNIDGSIIEVNIMNVIMNDLDGELKKLEIDEDNKKEAKDGNYDEETINEFDNEENINLEETNIKKKKKRKN